MFRSFLHEIQKGLHLNLTVSIQMCICLSIITIYSVASFSVFAHPINNPTFNLYFNIPSQLENPLCVHISNGLFYPVLLHIHCKQLGSQLAFYESIYVRPVFLNQGLMMTQTRSKHVARIYLTSKINKMCLTDVILVSYVTFSAHATLNLMCTKCTLF